MMHHSRCNRYHVADGSCSCGWFYNPNNSLSMMTSVVPSHNSFDEENDVYHYSSSSSPSSSVDCTLSLGTPSTRLSDNVVNEKRQSKFGNWNFFQTSKSHESSSSSHKNNRNASNNSYSGGNGDNHPARRCANCNTSTTPLWRNGPKGPKSLCNACGIRYKKEERRATAAAAAAAATNNNNSDIGGNVAGAVDGHHMLNSSWVHYSQNQKMPYVSSAYGNDFSFVEDQNIDDSGNPFLSWSLNVH